MSLNGVNGTSGYSKNYEYEVSNKKQSNNTSGSASANEASTKAASTESAAAVYEASSKATASTSTTNTTKANSALIAKMKADANNRISQLQSLVETMFKKQGVKIGTADDMWRKLASGQFTADAGTIAQAKEDISDNGYWGVSQTSDRIFDFAVALSGGDESKMEEMRKAVEKGFRAATKSWGSSLPSISNDTYDAVMKKFDNYSENASSTVQPDEA